jgi:hypothetical protein
MTHGVTLYQNLLSPGTARALREFIERENKVREGFSVSKSLICFLCRHSLTFPSQTHSIVSIFSEN